MPHRSMALAVVLLSLPAAAQESPSFDHDAWVDRVSTLNNHNDTAFRVIPQLIQNEPDRAFAVVNEAWDRVLEDKVKTGILKAFTFRDHPQVLSVLHLGVTDPSLEVQNYALVYAGGYALTNFAEDIQAYHDWYAAYRGKPLGAVVVDSARSFAKQLSEAAPARQDELLVNLDLARLGTFPEARRAVIDAGLLDVIMAIVDRPGTPRESIHSVGQLLSKIQPDETFVREQLLPLLDIRTSSERQLLALKVIGHTRSDWAVSGVLSHLFDVDDRSLIRACATSLGELQDPSVIPSMIGMIDAVPGYDTIYGIGYFGLSPLTGVRYHESHDGPWWRDWWDKNKFRYGEEVGSMEIPDLRGRIAFRAIPDSTQSSPSLTFAGFDVDERRAHGDPNMEYHLMGNLNAGLKPANAHALLLVLPGGDGSSEFVPFVRRMHQNALSEEFLIAELVAKEWTPGQFEQIVWPTEKRPWRGAEFTTELFAQAVIQDVQKDFAIDPERIYALAWSSGGPAVYALMLNPESPLKGAFIAMSVFKPDQLPPVENARGKGFYIYHSPEDFIQMRFPELAVRSLREAGARTHLQHYSGGHGWHGNVYADIRAGIQWLELQADR